MRPHRYPLPAELCGSRRGFSRRDQGTRASGYGIRYRDGSDAVRGEIAKRDEATGRAVTAGQDFLVFFFPMLGKRFFTAALTFFCSAGVPC